jgi:glycosyltransferase involved in cell wall biosynthesis
MRVTYVIQRFGREVIGGGESFCRAFASRLAARGHDVSVVTGRALETADWADHYPDSSDTIDGVTVHRLPTHPATDRQIIDTLGQLAYGNPQGPDELHYAWQRAQGPLLHTLNEWLTAHRDRIDVLIPVTQFYFPATEALLMSKRLDLPTLFHPLAHEEPSLNLELFAKTFALATAFGFLTEEEETLVRTRFGSRQPGLVHGVGVELDAPVDATAMTTMRLPMVPYLCYVGRCTPYKMGDAVEFVRRFRATHGDRVELVIVGEHQDWLPAERGIRLTGFLDDPARNAVLKQSLALLMPSAYESFSMVLTEAWALGRPALVNGNCGPLRGQATRSKGAIAYDDYAQFEEGLLALLNESELATRMGAAGRAYTEIRYEWDHVMDGYEGILEQAAGRTRRKSGVPSPSQARRSGNPQSRAAAASTRVTSATCDSVPLVRWEGAIFKHHSLSEVNRQLVSSVLAISDGGESSQIEIGHQREGRDIAPPGRLLGLAASESTSPSPSVELTIRHQWPPDLSEAPHGELAVMQLWEFGCVPQTWVDALDNVAEFWVSSEWLRRCYLASGVPESRVVTIPLGVDLERFTPHGEVMVLNTDKTIKLLFVGGTIGRKGIDVLLAAYGVSR